MNNINTHSLRQPSTSSIMMAYLDLIPTVPPTVNNNDHDYDVQEQESTKETKSAKIAAPFTSRTNTSTETTWTSTVETETTEQSSKNQNNSSGGSRTEIDPNNKVAIGTNPEDAIKLNICNLYCYGCKYLPLVGKTPKFEENQSLFIIYLYRKSCTLLYAAFAAIFGLWISISIIVHTTVDISICSQYNLSTSKLIVFDDQYAHLYAWEACKYKVYPFGDATRTPCQCRNMIVTANHMEQWHDTLKMNNITDNDALSKIFLSILKEYYMMETFYFDATEHGYTNVINLTNDLMVSKNLKAFYLESMQFGYISDEMGYNWKNLEFFRIDFSHVSQIINADSFSSMTQLKWFAVGRSGFDVNNLNWICNLQHLGKFGLSPFIDNITVPDCINQLTQLQVIGNEYFSNINVNVLTSDNLYLLDAFQISMQPQLLEQQLITMNSTGDYGYGNENDMFDIIGEKKLYLQFSYICDEFEADTDYFEQLYPLSYKLIEATQACTSVCDESDVFAQRTCRPFWYHDGVCQDACHNQACGYDGGDCVQMCDFSVCNYTSLGDGICNDECRNKNCAFDYCDCFDINNINDATDDEQRQCYTYNATICDIKTDCQAFDKNNSKSWLTDGFCDDYCNNEYCNYDNGQCLSCQGICQTFYTVFDIVANSDSEDDKVSVFELCSHWTEFVVVVVGSQVSEIKYNCSQFLTANDLNDDAQLNGYESVRAAFWATVEEDKALEEKSSQLNCSLCSPSVEAYYS